jgi:hypothetical protein
MSDPVLWLGGWASDPACWQEVIGDLYPGREHAFLDAHAVLDRPDILVRALADFPEHGTLAAWSMGSLILHKRLAAGSLSVSCRILSLCPIFAFCGSGSPWSPAVLKKMERKLSESRETVLRNFWERMKTDSHVSPACEDAWFRQSRKYDTEALRRGLVFLRETTVDAPALAQANTAGKSAAMFFAASPKDPLSPFPAGESPPFPAKSWTTYPSGHLPFLDYPGLVEAFLRGEVDKPDAGVVVGSVSESEAENAGI